MYVVEALLVATDRPLSTEPNGCLYQLIGLGAPKRRLIADRSIDGLIGSVARDG